MKTADLLDEHDDQLDIVHVPQFKWFGKKNAFYGKIETVHCLEDNSKAKALLSTDGTGKVLVVDGQGSARHALMGDNVARLAVENNWSGVVINGHIRDSAEINTMPVGVLALGTTPRRSRKEDIGTVNTVLYFSGGVFTPGDYIYCDEDGMLLSPNNVIDG